jgi:hypothetical protein
MLIFFSWGRCGMRETKDVLIALRAATSVCSSMAPRCDNAADVGADAAMHTVRALALGSRDRAPCHDRQALAGRRWVVKRLFL